MLARASCVGTPHAIHKVHEKSSNYRTLLFRKVFERSWHSLPDKVTRVLSFTAVWHWRSYLFHLSSISFQLNFHANPLKIKKRAFNLLVLQIWSIFFLLWFFLFLIIYKIGMPFQFHPLIFFFKFRACSFNWYFLSHFFNYFFCDFTLPCLFFSY
jgi:hypothetical protein